MSVAAMAQPAAPAILTDSARVAPIVQRVMHATHAPGVAVRITRPGHRPISLKFGMADVERRIPVSSETVFEIGSVTKEFTAAALMQLVEQGRVSLDDEINRWLPGLRTAPRRVTLRQLLSHTSGIHASLNPAPDGSLPKLLFDFEPGSDWSYSNAGYLLLGRVVERVSGASWDDYVRAHLSGPLHLESIASCRRVDSTGISVLAEGYRVEGDDTLRHLPRADFDLAFTAGGLCATASDVAAWNAALAAGRVVTPRSYQMMTAPTTLPDGRSIPYGFGIQVSRLGPYTEHMHEGDIAGFSAAVSTYPTESLTVAVLANAEGVPALRVARDLARVLLSTAAEPQRDLPLSANQRSQLVGLYVVPPSTACRVAEVEGGIGYGCGGPIRHRMLYQGDGVFEDPGAPEWRLEFVGWTADHSTHVTGWRELYYGLPMMSGRWTGR